jgi:hypothetical protein
LNGTLSGSFTNASCSVAQPVIPTNAFKGDYFSDPNLTTLATSRTDAAVNFLWDAASPAAGVPADHFSARWEGNWTFVTSGNYRFYVTADDGARLWVDGNQLINQWRDESETSYTADVTLSSGTHNIKMEYYDNYGDATAILSWTLNPSDLIAREKAQACTADGVLWGGSDEMYGRSGIADLADHQNLIANSNCALLNRAIETWTSPPNFTAIQNRINTLQNLSGGKNFIYGMFVAEAIWPEADSYSDPLSAGQSLDFSSMCVPGSTNAHGLGTDCAPEFRSPVYRQYVKSITQRAIDMGVRDFVFGAMDFQDARSYSAPNGINVNTDLWTTPAFPQIFADIRAYASSKGVAVTIGCQFEKTGRDYSQFSHLKLCDYKYAPLMTGIVDTTSWSAGQWDYPSTAANWSNGDWNNSSVTSQTNVLVDYEWWPGFDDIDRLITQPKQERAAFLWHSYWMVRNAGQGLLMPFMEPLNNNYSAQWLCPVPRLPDGSDPYYSPSDKYCGDQDVMNDALSGGSMYLTADQHYVPSGGGTTLRWFTPQPNTCTVTYGLWLNGNYGDTNTYGPITNDMTYVLKCPDNSQVQTTVHVGSPVTNSRDRFSNLANALSALESLLRKLLKVGY